MKSLRQGFGGEAPNVPHREAIKEKSSQGAKRYLTVDSRRARAYLRRLKATNMHHIGEKAVRS